MSKTKIQTPVRYDAENFALEDSEGGQLAILNVIEPSLSDGHLHAIGNEIANAINDHERLKQTLAELVAAAKRATGELKDDHVYGNKHRLGLMGSDSIEWAVCELETAIAKADEVLTEGK